MVRISVIALAIAALLASAPGMAVAKEDVEVSAHVHGRLLRRGRRGHAVRAADAMLCLINGERAKHGDVGAARGDERSRSAALGHSTEGRSTSSCRTQAAVAVAVASSCARSSARTYTTRGDVPSLLGETIAFGAGSMGDAGAARVVRSCTTRCTAGRCSTRRFRDAGVGFALGAPMSGVGGSSATRHVSTSAAAERRPVARPHQPRRWRCATTSARRARGSRVDARLG